MPRTRVLQHHYNARTQKWSKAQSEVEIDDNHFGEGIARTHKHTRSMTAVGRLTR